MRDFTLRCYFLESKERVGIDDWQAKSSKIGEIIFSLGDSLKSYTSSGDNLPSLSIDKDQNSEHTCSTPTLIMSSFPELHMLVLSK